VKFGQRCAAGQDRPPEFIAPAGVTIGHEPVEFASINDRRRRHKRSRHRVHAANVADEQVVACNRLTT
jgi:hypothetical protein